MKEVYLDSARNHHLESLGFKRGFWMGFLVGGLFSAILFIVF